LASKILPTLEFYVINMIIGSMHKKDGQLYTVPFSNHLETRFKCSKPTNQQFKCQVYKNGEVIG
jgi:hypothetical protein